MEEWSGRFHALFKCQILPRFSETLNLSSIPLYVGWSARIAQRFPFLCGVSDHKSILEASMKNELFHFLVPLGCLFYRDHSTLRRFAKTSVTSGWTCTFSIIMRLCKGIDDRWAAKSCFFAVLQCNHLALWCVLVHPSVVMALSFCVSMALRDSVLVYWELPWKWSIRYI